MDYGCTRVSEAVEDLEQVYGELTAQYDEFRGQMNAFQHYFHMHSRYESLAKQLRGQLEAMQGAFSGDRIQDLQYALQGSIDDARLGGRRQEFVSTYEKDVREINARINRIRQKIRDIRRRNGL